MFDSIRVENGKFQTINKNVHEHRAPTDDSVKLLTEMEEKAASKLISRIHIQDNDINAEFWFSRNPGMQDLISVIYRIKINGWEQEKTLTVEFNRLLGPGAAEKAVVMEVLKSIRETIMKPIAHSMLTSLMEFKATSGLKH